MGESVLASGGQESIRCGELQGDPIRLEQGMLCVNDTATFSLG